MKQAFVLPILAHSLSAIVHSMFASLYQRQTLAYLEQYNIAHICKSPCSVMATRKHFALRRRRMTFQHFHT